MIDPSHSESRVRRRCELLGLSRSTPYYEPAPETPENLGLMRLIDEEYARHPFYGSRRMAVWLKQEKGHVVNRKRVRRLMRLMGIEAIYPKPSLSAGSGHRVYPYLLRDGKFGRADQVWSTDITYIPTREGWLYLAVVEGLFSRRVVGWSMADEMESRLVVDALGMADRRRLPGEGLLALGPGQPVRQRALPTPRRAWDRMQHERGGAVLGRRPGRVVLRHAEEATGPRRGLPDQGRGEGQHLRVHRGLLQQPESPLVAGVRHPGGLLLLCRIGLWSQVVCLQ